MCLLHALDSSVAVCVKSRKSFHSFHSEKVARRESYAGFLKNKLLCSFLQDAGSCLLPDPRQIAITCP